MKYLLILTFLFAFIGCETVNNKNTLLIKNLSAEVITNMKIEYSNGIQTSIGILNSGSEYKVKLEEPVNETSVNLIYVDKKKGIQKVLVIPYLLLAESKHYQYEIK